jgi:hypothetical protein
MGSPAAPRDAANALASCASDGAAPPHLVSSPCPHPNACRHFAQTRPFAILPGMNHAQFSNGVCNVARGDIPSDLPLDTQSAAVAGLVAAFIAANHPAASAESARGAVDQLLQASRAGLRLARLCSSRRVCLAYAGCSYPAPHRSCCAVSCPALPRAGHRRQF